MPPPSNWRELSGLVSTPELFAASPLAGRVVFVLGPPHSRAESLAAAIARLPGVDPRLRRTDLFNHGVPRLVGSYGMTKHADRIGGIAALVADDTFLRLTRGLLDDLFAGADGVDGVLVECSPGHADALLLIELLYPDAAYVHVAGRASVVAAGAWRSSRSLRSAAGAVRRATRAERAVADARARLADLGCPAPRAHDVDDREVAAQPEDVLRAIAAMLGLDAGSAAVAAAATGLRAGRIGV